MYVPGSFMVTDDVEIQGFLERYDFATLVSSSPTGLIGTHVPVILRDAPAGRVLVGHVARANSHWEFMDGTVEALAIFHGPHAYVSPTWYVNSPAVPTWNYAVVHVYGKPRARPERGFLESVLEELTVRYEGGRSTPWRMESLPPEFRSGLMAAIVGFEMPVDRIEAKYKLSQNRRFEDRSGTLAGLEAEGSAESAAVAALMRSQGLGG